MFPFLVVERRGCLLLLLVNFCHNYSQGSITSGVQLLLAFDYHHYSITVSVRLLPAFVYSRRSFTADVRLQCSYHTLHIK